MNDELKEMLTEWSDPLGSRTMTDAEDLIHALQVEIGGMSGLIRALEDDLRHYKLRGDPTGFDMNMRLFIHVYNSGYHAGHHDTVEGTYTDVLPVDMDNYHDDIVSELLANRRASR